MTNPTAVAWSAIASEIRLEEWLGSGGPPIELTAQRIKELTGREPRLMTKFDTRESRPSVLRGVTILPLSNGTYALLNGDGYVDVPLANRVRRWPVSAKARQFVTLPWDNGPASESQALDMALATGLLEDFLEDTVRLTIRGRLRSPSFDFWFDSAEKPVRLTANGVQIEVDAGLEGQQIHLIEAKLGARTNFHNRQLYYPYRMWQKLVPEKSVSTVFLSYSNRCFSLRRFDAIAERVEHYHGFVATKAVDYHFDESTPIPSLEETLADTELRAQDADVPFPQANEIRRVIDVIDSVAAGLCTRNDISSHYDLDDRQADYYANAATFLGLLVRRGNGFALTEQGCNFSKRRRSERIVWIIRELASRPVFRQVLEATSRSGKLPSRDAVSEWIREYVGLTGKTPNRRAGTVLAWSKWILENTSAQLTMAFD